MIVFKRTDEVIINSLNNFKYLDSREFLNKEFDNIFPKAYRDGEKICFKVINPLFLHQYSNLSFFQKRAINKKIKNESNLLLEKLRSLIKKYENADNINDKDKHTILINFDEMWFNEKNLIYNNNKDNISVSICTWGVASDKISYIKKIENDKNIDISASKKTYLILGLLFIITLFMFALGNSVLSLISLIAFLYLLKKNNFYKSLSQIFSKNK